MGVVRIKIGEKHCPYFKWLILQSKFTFSGLVVGYLFAICIGHKYMTICEDLRYSIIYRYWLNIHLESITP